MKYSVGLDIGSTSTEIVAIDINRNIIYKEKTATGSNMTETGNFLFTHCIKHLGEDFKKFQNIVVTGYGRKSIELNDVEKIEKTEISCFGKGAYFLNDKIHTVIDIGGQDSKAIILGKSGKVINFAMNDKCAAGTGKFLELIAKQFNIDINEIGNYSINSTKKIVMSTICAVFAESEIVSRVSEGNKIEDIIKAVEISIAKRVCGMASRFTVADDVMFCGGVAKNKGMIRAIKEILDKELYIPEYMEFVGAIGAALFGLELV
ncbi:MAG: 2-hydroxyglutaryl-CoA dehydratase [Spirochaetales bacterium]|nr:2-hydroxyglutaryl-CoA dehydratase [Spirochaetales bacterium]